MRHTKLALVWILAMLFSMLFLMGPGGCPPEPECVDSDQDGYGSPASSQCSSPELDCHPDDFYANPGQYEGPFGDDTCSDNLDNDCDGFVDEDDLKCIKTCFTDEDCNDQNPCTLDVCDDTDRCTSTCNAIDFELLCDNCKNKRCTNCAYLRSKMKFGHERYFCRYRGCIENPNEKVCDHWEE